MADTNKQAPVGCLPMLGVAFGCFLVYLLSGPVISWVKYQLSPPVRVYISKPGWGCDDYNESFAIVKTEYPSYWSKWLYGQEHYLKPFPRGANGDTTRFQSYFKKIVPVWNDTVVLVGKLGLETIVGEKTMFGQCDPIPYFEANALYTKRGKLIRRF